MSAAALDTAGLRHGRRRGAHVRASAVRGAPGERPMGRAADRQGGRRRRRPAPASPVGGRRVIVRPSSSAARGSGCSSRSPPSPLVAGALWWRWRHPRRWPWRQDVPIANVDHADGVAGVRAACGWRYRMLIGAELAVLSVAGIAAAVLAMRPLERAGPRTVHAQPGRHAVPRRLRLDEGARRVDPPPVHRHRRRAARRSHRPDDLERGGDHRVPAHRRRRLRGGDARSSPSTSSTAAPARS